MPDELKAVIDEAHRLGMVVLMDIYFSAFYSLLFAKA